jgi:DNA-binding NarL/FixJ family response regulator
MLRILIADDHAIVRKGLREILREAPEYFEIGEAADGDEALAMALAGPWDAIVLDITMPRRSGLEVLRELQRERPALPVVMLTMHAGKQYIRGALAAGAMGFVTKEAATDELLTALRAALAGEIYVSDSLLDIHD